MVAAPTPTLAGLAEAPFHRTAPVAPPAHHRPPPPPPAAKPHYRTAPRGPALAPTSTASAASEALLSATASCVVMPGPEKLPPRAPPPLPSNVDVREMGYRLQRMVEQLQRVRFEKFDVLFYRKLVSTSAPERSFASRMNDVVDAAEAAHRARMRNLGMPEPHAPSRYNYFDGLHSQMPRRQTLTYFLKVDARWPGGFGHVHLRVRLVPPARQPLGAPSSIPPLSEAGLVLEGVLLTRPQTPLEVFGATMSQPQVEASASVRRAAPTSAWP
jgi:hypothetical protein